MSVSEHANYLLNEYGRLQFDYAAYCKPDGESLRNEARNNLETYIAELEGEIAKMKKYFHKPAHGTCCTCQKCGHTYDECRCDFDEALDDLDKANARIAELEAENETIISDYEERMDNLVNIGNETGRLLQAEIGYLNAQLDIKNLTTKTLQLRIAELEAAQRWIPVSERLPEEDTDGNTLMAICRHSGEWVRAPFGAEFADEFVRHYSYWMYAPQPPEVQE